MRKSIAYLIVTTLGGCLLMGMLLLHPLYGKAHTAERLARERALVARLALTDICLFTEAAYLRHPNMADRFSPFQDFPMALTHFPSESLLPPPKHLFEARHCNGGMP